MKCDSCGGNLYEIERGCPVCGYDGGLTKQARVVIFWLTLTISICVATIHSMKG